MLPYQVKREREKFYWTQRRLNWDWVQPTLRCIWLLRRRISITVLLLLGPHCLRSVGILFCFGHAFTKGSATSIKFYRSSRLRDRRIGTACFYQLLSKFYRSNLVFVASRNVVLREVVSDPGTKTACTHGCESSPAPHLFVSLSLSASSSITLSTSSHVHVRGVWAMNAYARKHARMSERAHKHTGHIWRIPAAYIYR